MTAHGTYTTVDGRPAVRFERRLAHPPDAVWRMVTDPAELKHWFPCEVDVELRVGGPMRFVFSPDFALDGEVLELDEPRRFAFLWGEDVLRFDLLHTEGEDAAAKTAAGWHVCLDGMERRLAGDEGVTETGSPTPEWQARYDEYVARGFPSGAEIPG
jgi:Activator of Hsp90 ATPase homolog 1-like protein